MSKSPPPQPAARPRRGPRLALRLLLALGLTLLCVELLLRWLLLGGSELAARLGAPLRRPELFADQRYDDVYWLLHSRYLARERRRPLPRHDPLLGYLRRDVTPLTYVHADEAAVGERRPVLLFGDSFAGCVTGPEDCFQGLLETSALGRDHALVNFGTGGYGFDQIVLLLEQVLPRLAARDPIVIVSLLVDSDLERSGLRFRGWPKAHFALAPDGGLELQSGALPPTSEEYVARAPLGVASFAGRWLIHGSGLLGEELRARLARSDARVRHLKELNARLFARAQAAIEASGVEAFYLLFHGREALGSALPWQDAFVEQQLEAMGARWLPTRPFLQIAASESGRDPLDYFYLGGRGRNHLTPEGNRVVFEALERGIAGRFEDPTPPRAQRIARITTGGEGAAARWVRAAEGAPARLLLRPGADGASRIVWELGGECARFTARLERAPGATGTMFFTAVVDGAPALREQVGAGFEPRALELALAGAQRLVLVAAPGGEGRQNGGLWLVDPALEEAAGSP